MSEAMARSIAQRYPTLRSLVNVYRDSEMPERAKRELLANACGTGRRQAKLSGVVYDVFTAQDPRHPVRE